MAIQKTQYVITINSPDKGECGYTTTQWLYNGVRAIKDNCVDLLKLTHDSLKFTSNEMLDVLKAIQECVIMEPLKDVYVEVIDLTSGEVLFTAYYNQ